MSRAITATIGVRRLLKSVGRDAHGNTSRRHADPVPIEVYAIYPAGSTEPNEQGRRPVVTGQTVLAPISAKGKIGAHDLVELPDGLTYEVVGRPRVWENNPHAHTRRNEGVQIELELSEG